MSRRALGRAVARRRRELALTQRATGLTAGLHPRYLSGLETGQPNPAWETVERIAAALDLKMSELARHAEQQHPW